MALIVELVNLVVLVGLVIRTDPATNVGEGRKKVQKRRAKEKRFRCVLGVGFELKECFFAILCRNIGQKK